ncbi:hypothetical protein FF100_33560 [Methylobacterium terricola]|uniref:Peptidase family M41 n=1 Tax=Methylobacterium terricola TaxID=2583531 RepID=A0A5C4L8W7_9HYPH|nr:hypothetical protein [Methylobacterium terricola]TNC07102.1 hypothetical protein FF100_33560 [Methylobacterium terricola]
MHSRAAIHEAGHAVAAVQLGLMLAHVSIVPDRDAAAHVALATSEGVSPKKLSIYGLAGGCAERAAFGGPSRGQTSDLAGVNRILRKIAPGEAEFGTLFTIARDEAEALVARNRFAIGIVARALDRELWIDGREVPPMLWRAGVAPEFVKGLPGR